jgi:thiamine-monophosphate kinase
MRKYFPGMDSPCALLINRPLFFFNYFVTPGYMTEQQRLEHIHAISRRTGFEPTGDDAAIFGELVVSTDQFIEGTHFTWRQMSPKQVGYKAVVQALSDLAAMASRPKAVLASLAWPKKDDDVITAVFSGIEQACIEYRVPLAGGDITSSGALTYMDFTVLGETARPARKKGARAGDLIAVTGPLGRAKGGLYCLDHGLNEERLVEAFRSPRARIETALALNEAGALTALTDISDSLSKSLHDFLRHSQTGARIDFARLPTDDDLRRLCEKKNLSLKDFMLYGGEDYELLMTL